MPFLAHKRKPSCTYARAHAHSPPPFLLYLFLLFIKGEWGKIFFFLFCFFFAPFFVILRLLLSSVFSPLSHPFLHRYHIRFFIVINPSHTTVSNLPSPPFIPFTPYGTIHTTTPYDTIHFATPLLRHLPPLVARSSPDNLLHLQ